MKYLSLFSGVEAASVAWRDLPNWHPVAFCEIDKFPSAVLAERFPNVPNLGDITKVDWNDFNEQYESVELIVGGSPCQSFSIAGGRESLDGESRLMYEYIRAIDEVKPKWIIWENVPGVLSTKDDAFGCLLRALQEIGYCDLAYRILDAQFYGVAQRRRRVFLVGYLAGGGFRSAAVLFDTESLHRDYTQNGKKRESLISKHTKRAGKGRAVSLASSFLDKHGKLESDELAQTLDVGSSPQIVCFSDDTKHASIDGDLVGTLTVGGRPPWILKTRTGAETYVKRDGSIGTAGKGALVEQDVTFTLTGVQDMTLIDESMPPRRLTPLECERLQGFPDNWTRIAYNGKPESECPDGPRYKAMGNSMAVPVMRWIGERIQMCEEILNEQDKINTLNSAI